MGEMRKAFTAERQIIVLQKFMKRQLPLIQWLSVRLEFGQSFLIYDLLSAHISCK